jgi:hypothetical protein
MTFRKLYEVEQQKKAEKAELKLISKKDQFDLNVDLEQNIGDQSRPVAPLDGQLLDGWTATLDGQEKMGGHKKPDGQKELHYPSRIEKTKMTLRIANNKVEQYKIWCFVNKISLQEAVEKAMDMLLDGQLMLDGWTAGRPLDHDLDPISDDLIDDKSSSIMEFYSKWTGNKIKDGDKETYKDVANLDEKIIQVGILLTVVRAKNRIGSFKYCLGAIEETSKQKINNPDSYIKYLIDKINKTRTAKSNN